MILIKQKHKPGNAVQRFGDWRKGEPQVLVDNETWKVLGGPKEVKIEFIDRKRQKWLDNVS